jgi:hypothetical protein
MPRLADELYDLRADPHELSNDVAARPQVVERMRKQTAEMLAAHGGRIQ